jgi:biotin carboxyl carrier protein
MTALHDLTRPPRPAAADHPLGRLLAWEAELRRFETLPELVYYLANETRRLVPIDQMFVLRRGLTGEGWQVRAASGLPGVDRNAPAIRAIEAVMEGAGATPTPLVAPDGDEALEEYPFRHWYWQPLVDRAGAAFAGLLAVRATPFDDNDAARFVRVAETAQHGWLALTGGKPVRRLPKLSPRTRRMLLAAAGIAAIFPVHMSVLAPVEVVAAHPFVVTAPFQGVVGGIDVAPSTPVAKGQTLLHFDDVKLRNEMDLAAQRLQVARAKVDEVSSASFGDAKQAHGISIAQAEYQLAQAEYDYARDMLARAHVAAPQAGIAIYTDRRDWEGKAVDVGQPIMEVADPADIAYRIDLPAREQMKLEPGSSVSVWLNSQPLWSQSATLADASYQARPTADGTLAFALTATPSDHGTPRIGSRGTARVRGPWVPLCYAMLKRPVSGLRQLIGL